MNEIVQINIQVSEGPSRTRILERGPQILSGGTEGELRAAFKAACDAFNAFDCTIGGLLAKDVKVYSVKHQDLHTPRDGLNGAINYFAGQFALDHPRFDPNYYGDPQFTINGPGTRGKVVGQAYWKDQTSPNPDHLDFTFRFIYDDNLLEWLIDDLYSKPR